MTDIMTLAKERAERFAARPIKCEKTGEIADAGTIDWT